MRSDRNIVSDIGSIDRQCQRTPSHEGETRERGAFVASANDQITQRSSTRDAFTRFVVGSGRGRGEIMVKNAWLLTRSRCRRPPRANSLVSTKYDWSTWWRVARCVGVRRPCCWKSNALWPPLGEPAIPSLGGKETLTLPSRTPFLQPFVPTRSLAQLRAFLFPRE